MVTDRLTGLANRELPFDRLDRALTVRLETDDQIMERFADVVALDAPRRAGRRPCAQARARRPDARTARRRVPAGRSEARGAYGRAECPRASTTSKALFTRTSSSLPALVVTCDS
jgi:hypothetical protein